MPAASHHKALFLTSNRGSFEVGDQETPKPSHGELLVRIEASALNPVDWKIQTYGSIGSIPASYPAVLGADIAGIVEEVGEGVTEFFKGDKVFHQGAWSNATMGFQQYCLTSSDLVGKIPPNISFDEATSLPSAIAAGFIGLYAAKPDGAALTAPLTSSTRGIYSGKPLLVLGGAASIGQLAIQFARLSGFSPILTTASQHHEEFLKSLRATHIVDRNISRVELVAEIQKITSEPLKVVYDAIASSQTQQYGYDVLAEGGHLSVALPLNLEPTEGKNVTYGVLRGNWVLPDWVLPETRKLGLALYPQLHELLERGLIKPNRVEVLPKGLRGIGSGLERMKTGEVSGIKLVARPQETE